MRRVRSTSASATPVGLLFAIAFASLLLAAAHAAFPGQNGKIAFERNGDIWTMNPDGSGQTNLTNNAAFDWQPTWSPDGKKIAFQSYRDGNFEIYVMDADGSGATRLTNNGAYDTQPAWSPDGSQIVFASNRDGGNPEIYKMNADGSGQTRLTNNTQADAAPAWSPDGTRIAFDRFLPSGATSPKYDIFTMAPNGGDEVDITSWAPDASFETAPEWSPDGSKITFAWGQADNEIGVMNADGSNPADITNAPSSNEGPPAWSPDGSKIAFVTDRNDPSPISCGADSCQDDIYVMDSSGGSQTRLTSDPAADDSPDWQPLPATPGPGYPRPKGATPFQTYFTLAYKPCVSPTRQHGAPLAVLSCNPPQQASNFLTVGTLDANMQQAKSVGSYRLDVKASPADVKITFALKDVRNKLDLSDYTGELRVTENWRLTDKNNGPSGGGGGSDPATNQDIPFVPLDVTCSGTPSDSTVGSTCNSQTTANALIPGSIQAGIRMNSELGQVQVNDGGADGVAATETDNTLFMDQGIFIP